MSMNLDAGAIGPKSLFRDAVAFFIPGLLFFMAGYFLTNPRVCGLANSLSEDHYEKGVIVFVLSYVMGRLLYHLGHLALSYTYKIFEILSCCCFLWGCVKQRHNKNVVDDTWKIWEYCDDHKSAEASFERMILNVLHLEGMVGVSLACAAFYDIRFVLCVLVFGSLHWYNCNRMIEFKTIIRPAIKFSERLSNKTGIH